MSCLLEILWLGCMLLLKKQSFGLHAGLQAPRMCLALSFTQLGPEKCLHPSLAMACCSLDYLGKMEDLVLYIY